ncbi:MULTISPECIES: sigma-70 family RNA polymerase sigma factor [Aminobacterium]|jgi:RNA polymerase sigma factor for flagellar operon FliA|uniref:sigma-70 family RNA polymerase sigma factor n=1 Tax=Aminobacterium TaxID=81466 RepID=UPI002580236C|nr:MULTISPECIES: FliA/WhiG family RNA polymerase sigma factor [unclassified Aminobacterium]
MKERDQELWTRYFRDRSEAAKEEVVCRYLPLVKYVVGRMAVSPPSGLDYDDLLSFGVFGLLDAIDRFDLEKGAAFQTFAVPRIRGAVLDELRKYDWISRTGREKIQKLNRAVDKVLQDQGVVSDAVLMNELEMDEKTYRETLEIASRSYIVSLDEVLALDDGEVVREGVLADDASSALEVLEESEEVEKVVSALEKLPERERFVISLYYYEGLTLKEIGSVLGVTESRVSQLHGKALVALRRMLQAK